jgi:hypothetical protein
MNKVILVFIILFTSFKIFAQTNGSIYQGVRAKLNKRYLEPILALNINKDTFIISTLYRYVGNDLRRVKTDTLIDKGNCIVFSRWGGVSVDMIENYSKRFYWDGECFEIKVLKINSLECIEGSCNYVDIFEVTQISKEMYSERSVERMYIEVNSRLIIKHDYFNYYKELDGSNQKKLVNLSFYLYPVMVPKGMFNIDRLLKF